MKRAVFPGSFDPLTMGHYDIICRGMTLFDEIILAIGVNANKKYMFSLEERKQFLTEAFKNDAKIKVDTYKGLTVDYCVEQEADFILREEIRNAGFYKSLWQAFVVLLPIKTVGVMGDKRTYENTAVIRAVESKDAMTADWAKLPYELLGKISNRIINEVQGINRVAYDISSKPPATIEWE